ncbi:ABC transporter permease [Oryzihumus leptocrescens]|uniref:Peptide/nickel transport system permease protein n=1 Tax=Oryzihumus leptocrescens TaxID=297536 RepID=A0A542ZMH0_9MICO|nr:ABC transporter permease [Oryzihumus leptocrescens]TQL61525.1 peptide/nickel transport system permease protein [Oryzihumus leptocrescens]
MFFYIIRRLIAVVIMLFVISMTTFLVFYAGPDDPARLTCAKNCTPAVIAANRHAFGFDKPIATQYTDFVKGLVSERKFPDDPAQEKAAPQTITHCAAPCLGYSFVRQQPVTAMIKQGLPITVSLAVGAFVIWIVVGVTSGCIAALNRGTFIDRTIVGAALIGFSLPSFFIGLLLLTFVAIRWQLVPIPEFVPFTENPALWAQNLILPWITLAAIFAASYVRLTRAYMLETMSEDYIRTARAKGVKENKVIRRHGLRAALTPIVTAAGLDLGGLLGGAVITESVFGLNGLGRMAVQAVVQTDLPMIVALVLVAAAFVVIANLVVDVLYGVIDPRVRLS